VNYNELIKEIARDAGISLQQAAQALTLAEAAGVSVTDPQAVVLWKKGPPPGDIHLPPHELIPLPEPPRHSRDVVGYIVEHAKISHRAARIVVAITASRFNAVFLNALVDAGGHDTGADSTPR
jgi:hypothetical protein